MTQIWLFLGGQLALFLVGVVTSIRAWRRRVELGLPLCFASAVLTLMIPVEIALLANSLNTSQGDLYRASWIPAACGAVAVWQVRRAAGNRRWRYLPFLLANAILAIFLLLRYLVVSGVDVGPWGFGFLTGQYIILTLMAFFLSVFFPALHWVPFAVPLQTEPASRGTLWLFRAGQALATLFVASTVLFAVVGTGTSRSLVELRSTQPPPRAHGRHVSVRLLTNMKTMPEEAFVEWELQRLEELGADHASFFVHGDVLEDDASRSGFAALLARLRTKGLKILIHCDGPAGQPFSWGDGLTPERYFSTMQRINVGIAKLFAPDIQVPFVEPFAAQRLVTGGLEISPERWSQELASTCRLIARESPSTRTATYFAAGGDQERRFAGLCAAREHPVDLLGFSIYGIFGGEKDLLWRLDDVRTWISTIETQKSWWVFETGHVPLTQGGLWAQAGFLDAVLRFSCEVPIVGVNILSLVDDNEPLGLIGVHRGSRPAFAVVRSFARNRL